MSNIVKPVSRGRAVQVSPVAAQSIRDKFVKTRQEFNASLIERETEVDVVLSALLAQESVLLIGPPGTAKSLLCDGVCAWIKGSRFNYLMTKYTDPAEIFGPYGFESYKQGLYERLTQGYLPEADVVFLDEVIKGSSAILNTLLRAINERKMRNGTKDVDLPMRLLVGASNEVPPPESIKELGALLDRFLCLTVVRSNLTKAGRHRLLSVPTAAKYGHLVHADPANRYAQIKQDRDHTPRLSTSLTLAELDQASTEAQAMLWSDEAEQALEVILDEIEPQFNPSKRREYKAIKVIQAYAWLNEADLVQPEHLEIAKTMLWSDPAQLPTVADIVMKVANPVGATVQEKQIEVDELLRTCKRGDFASEGKCVKMLGSIGRELKVHATTNKKAAALVKQIAAEIVKMKLGAFDSGEI
jgi:MoxR-like ATPase